MGDTFPLGDSDVFTELTVDEWECVMSFHDFFSQYTPEVLAIEQVCYNEEEDYAGTIDLKLKIGEVVYLVDLKTSQNVWPEHELQVSAYKHTPQGEAEKCAVLQVGYRRNKRLWKFTEVEDCFELFLAAKKIWHRENDNVMPKQRDYPVELIIERKDNAENR
jgi:hypothetical protein